MSEQNPKPGSALSQLLNSVVQLELEIEREGRGGKTPDASVLTTILGKISVESFSPDDVKFLSDRLEGAAEKHQAEADQVGHIAYMLAASAREIRAKFTASLRAAGIDQIKGSTWTAKVVNLDPKLTVDWEVMKRDGQEYFVQVPAIDESKVMTALAAGIDVPGVKLVDHCDLELFVEKRVSK